MTRWTVWVGPVCVRAVAHLLRSAGAEGVTEGTEHVYFTARAVDLYELRAAFAGSRVAPFLRGPVLPTVVAGVAS